MEIKKEEPSDYTPENYKLDLDLLRKGSALKQIIVDNQDAPSDSKFMVILKKFSPALKRVEEYYKSSGCPVDSNIEEYRIVSDLFHATFTDFYKGIDDTTQISRRKTIRVSDSTTVSVKPGGKTKPSDTTTFLARNFDPNKTIIIRKPK